MQNLEKRIAALEAMRGSGLKVLTDEELEARIAALTECIAALEVAQTVDPLEVHHAEH